MKVLVVNAGSSSYKLVFYDLKDQTPSPALWKGKIEWGLKSSHYKIDVQTANGYSASHTSQKKDLKDNLFDLLATLWTEKSQVIEGPSAIEWVGHRVVHGGTQFKNPTLLTIEVKEQIRSLIPLAPLHNPFNLEGIECLEKVLPNIPQLAVFDTAFHSQLPEVVQTYPIPYQWKKEGIQRYGFHGISHQYCAERASQLIGQAGSQFNMINCHLGNGSSLCAISQGKSVDTTMGFTPLDGLMMGTRCGSIDPGILLYLLRTSQYSEEQLETILNFESGLKGISGLSDMRDLLESKESKSQLAVNMYVYRVRAFIGALLANLNGLDVLSFTGGIGENSAIIRKLICQHLEHVGIELDQQKNLSCSPDEKISLSSSPISIFVIHTEEEWMIAQACRQFQSSSRTSLS